MTVGDAGRVVAGVARGIRLEAPGPGTRPLADRVKQTLFAILDPDLSGANVLDLFAGSGAAGIEALSRGAAHATFVEKDKGAAAVIASNLGRTHLAGQRARIVRAEALAWLGGPDAVALGPFGVVIVDPPYAETGLMAASLEALAPLVVPGARVVAKHFWREPPPAVIGLLASERERRFGETTLTFYRRQEDR
jgi:16S rRNA (guanine966-N2)-methyltransferase